MIARRIQQSLVRNRYSVHVKLTQPSLLESSDLPDIAAASAVIVIGGDGTLRGVTHRLMRECRQHQCPPMLIIPLGTANLMGKHLGIKWKMDTLTKDVLRALTEGNVRKIDAAIVRGSGDNPSEQLLLLVAGVGIDAKIVHELSRLRRGPISYASYAVPAALALSRYRFPPITVRVDSKQVFTGRGIVLVGNVPEYGTGFSVLPRALADDGLLDICALPCRNSAELAKLFLLAAAGLHLSSKGVVYTTGKKVQIASRTPVEVQVDGDAAGWTPVQIQMLDIKVPFLVTQPVS